MRSLSTHKKCLVLNIVMFQVGWFACVLSAAANEPWTGIVLVMLIVSLHITFYTDKLTYLRFLLFATLIGSTWDSFLTGLSIFNFDSGMLFPWLAPSWIIAMWLLFATTIDISFRWLRDKYWLASITGAIAGPLPYFAGESLGAVHITDPLMTLVFLVVGWSILFPLLVRTAQMLDSETLILVQKYDT